MASRKTQQLGLLNLVRFIFILVLLFQHANRHLSRADNIWWGNMALPLLDGLFLLSGLIFQYQYVDEYKILSSSSIMNAIDKYSWQVKYIIYLIPTPILTICCATAGKWYIQYNHNINNNINLNTGKTTFWLKSTVKINFSTNGLVWPLITLLSSHIVFFAAIYCIENLITRSKLYGQQHFQNNQQQQKSQVTIFCGILTIIGFLSRYLWFDQANTDPQTLMFETWNEIRVFRIFNGICAFFSGFFVGEMREIILDSVEYCISVYHSGNNNNNTNTDAAENNNNEIGEQQQNIQNQQNIVGFIRSALFICFTFIISAGYVYVHYEFNYHKDKYIIPSSISIWCFILPMLLCISQIDLNVGISPFADTHIDNTAASTTSPVLQYFISACFMLGNIATIIYALHYLELVYLGSLLAPVSRFNSIYAFLTLTITLPMMLLYGYVAFYYLEVPCRRFILHYVIPYIMSFHVNSHIKNVHPQQHSILQDITDHFYIIAMPNDCEDKRTQTPTSSSTTVNDIV